MAKPTPLPLGRPNPHIIQSHGPESYIMNFYVTNYSTSFTKPNIDHNKGKYTDIPAYTGGQTFKPRSAPEYKETGFVSNVRPQIYYKKSLDMLDNPEMGRICEENYTTMHQIQFHPYKLNDGTEDLPVQVLDQKSAYTRMKSDHNARPAEVADLYINTKIRAPYDVLPNHKPLLHRLKNKDPIPKENYDYGVNYMSTEQKTNYKTPERPDIDINHNSVGPKEISGFVSNKEEVDVLNGLPGERWLLKTRPIGTTDYHDRFPPYDYPKGGESLPNLSGLKATAETGHTKSIKPSDINPKSAQFGNPTEYNDKYIGKQRLTPILSDKLGLATIGPKEETGQTRCEKGVVQQFDDPRRFITNYQIKHFDMNPKGKDREGYVSGGVNGDRQTGYTTDIKFHEPGKLNTLDTLENMQSYQARSIRARDAFYDDHSHEHKLSLKSNYINTYPDNNPYSVKLTCT